MEKQGHAEALGTVLAGTAIPQVWEALAQWIEVWQSKIKDPDGERGFDAHVLTPACQKLVGHLGALDWQGVPSEQLSRSRSLTVEMHRQLMLLQTDLRFLSVVRQENKRSQLLKQAGDRLRAVGQYCAMAQEHFEGHSGQNSDP